MDTLLLQCQQVYQAEDTDVSNYLSYTKDSYRVPPWKKKNDVLQVVKSSTKAIGVPDAIICDTSKAQTPQALR